MRRQDCEELALQAEMGRPLVHELSNLLNTVLLQIAVMERQPAPSIQDLAILRRNCKDLALLAQQWQRQRGTIASAGVTDLGGAFRDLTAEYHWTEVHVVLDLGEGPLPVAGPEIMVRCLARLLLKTLVEARAGGGPAPRLEASLKPPHVLVRAEEQTPGIVVHDLSKPFEPAGASPHGLALATLQSLVKRLGGSVQAERTAGGGLSLAFELPAAGP